MPSFDHEKLHAYQTAIQFIKWLQDIEDRIPKSQAIYKQLDRASISIALNIAEGNGKYSPRDRCRFFDIARGSAFECAAALDVLVAKTILQEKDVLTGKDMLSKIVSMLVGLIKHHSNDCIHESPAVYGMDSGEGE